MRGDALREAYSLGSRWRITVVGDPPVTGVVSGPDTGAAIPNGIAVAGDGRAFYFADSGRWRVAIVSRNGGGDDEIRYVDVGGAPDNLTISASGKILATVVTSSGDVPLSFICGFRGRTCRTGWAVWEIDPDTRRAAEILAGNGERIASVPVALEVGTSCSSAASGMIA
ncbi:MAG: hypothetical protein PVF90_00245 [Gemmatimonadota bacterium]